MPPKAINSVLERALMSRLSGTLGSSTLRRNESRRRSIARLPRLSARVRGPAASPTGARPYQPVSVELDTQRRLRAGVAVRLAGGGVFDVHPADRQVGDEAHHHERQPE